MTQKDPSSFLCESKFCACVLSTNIGFSTLDSCCVPYKSNGVLFRLICHTLEPHYFHDLTHYTLIQWKVIHFYFRNN